MPAKIAPVTVDGGRRAGAGWTDASKWSSGTVPTGADDVTISVAGDYTVSLVAATQSAKSITISDADATFAVDATGSGGTTLSIGGAIANGADFIIGNSTITSAAKVTGASLNNTGTIGLTGGSAAAVLAITGPIDNSGGLALSGKATLNGGAFLNRPVHHGRIASHGENLANTGTLNIKGGAAPASVLINSAAPTTLTLQVNLDGDALLRYASGAITAIGSGAGLSLDGTDSRVAFAATPGSNSALTTLASNAGNLDIENGASLTTTVAFSNTDTLKVDTDFFSGGSRLTLGGKLTNSGFVQIGNSGLTGATTVTTTALTNNAASRVFVTGNAAGDGATLTLTGASSNAISAFGTVTLDGVTVNGAIGGNGVSTLIFAQPGTDVMTNISGFQTINLADGGANSLTLTNANFTNVGGNVITVNGGDGNDTINASGLSAIHAIVFKGTGNDTVTAGAGDDVFFAGGNTTMTGGGGDNQFTFADIGTNRITDFAASAGNAFVVRDSGFNLGVNEGSGTGALQHLAAGVFVANGTGSFTTAGQRFAYNTTNGNLRYDADGSGAGSAASLVATLTGAPTLAAGAAGQVFFTS